MWRACQSPAVTVTYSLARMASLPSEKALRYAYDRARIITGRSGLTFHDLRHSAASLAGMTGATTRGAQGDVGHTTAGMVELYQHANRPHARDSWRT
jgi:integrase